jgi:hypothetical protein
MVASQLSDTRVELLAGSAIVDSAGQTPGTSVTLLYKNWTVHFPEQGVYRIDADPPRLWVFTGKADVSAGDKDASVIVGPARDVTFAPVLVPSQSTDRPHDALSLWSEGRQQSIFADNTIAANIQDPADLNLSNSDAGGFTYFPMLGLPSIGPSSSTLYSSVGGYQPGFYSVYLPGYAFFPGYTYLPLPLGVVAGGVVSPYHLPYVGSRPGVPPHAPLAYPMPRPPTFTHPTPVAPVTSHPAPVHAPSIGTHAVHH